MGFEGLKMGLISPYKTISIFKIVCLFSSSDYFKTNCDGYEAELSTCTTSGTNTDCDNGHAFVICNGIPELK